MPMIALSPVRVSWQKTTCSWSALLAEPLSLRGIANTFVTVATLSSRPGSSLNRDRDQAYCLRGRAWPAVLAGKYSRMHRDATISIARLTVSDSDRRRTWASRSRNFAPGGRRVTAGDGNMVPVDHKGHPHHAPRGAPGKQTKRRIAALVQEERPRTCPHAHPKPSRC